MQQLIDQTPPDGASREEWLAWASSLQRNAQRCYDQVIPQRKIIKTLKKEVKKKNVACAHYKRRISEYEAPHEPTSSIWADLAHLLSLKRKKNTAKVKSK